MTKATNLCDRKLKIFKKYPFYLKNPLNFPSFFCKLLYNL